MTASEAERAKIRIDHLKKDIAESAPKLKNAEQQNSKLFTEIKSSKSVIESLKV